jgi:hypothetical protein
MPGQHFQSGDRRACHTCQRVADANPLRYGINPSNELANLRSLLDEIREQRVPPHAALQWIARHSP